MSSPARGPMADHGSRSAALLWAAATLLATSLWWYARVIAPIRSPKLTILNYDLYAEVVPRLQFAFEAVRDGRLPLWNPFQLCGTPFLATQQHGVLYPLNLPHVFLPLAAALTAVALLHYAIAALGTAALARDLGVSRLGAVLAAVTFAISGSMFTRLYLPPHLYGATWLPIQLLLARRLCRHGPTAPALASLSIVCALQYLGGYGQYSLFAAYVMLGFALWSAPRRPWRSSLRSALAIGFAACLAIGLSAVQLAPAVELLMDSPRRLGVLGRAELDGFDLMRILRGLLLRPFPGFPTEGSLGTIALLLALVGATARRSARERGFLLALVAGGTLLAMGASAPFFGALAHLPGYTWFRAPSRALAVVSLGLALLAGGGLDRLVRSPSARDAAFRAAPALALLLAVSGALIATDASLAGLGPWSRFGWVLGFVAVAILGAGRGLQAPLLLIAAVAETVLLTQNAAILPHVAPRFFDAPPGAVSYLRRHQERWRTLIAASVQGFDPLPQPFQKTGMAEGLFAVGDYENLYARAYDEYLAALQRRRQPKVAWQGGVVGRAHSMDHKLLDLTSARFILASQFQPFVPPGNARFPVVYDDGTSRVLLNERAVPRAYVVAGAVPVDGTEAALRQIRSPSFEPRGSIAIEGWRWEGPPPASGPAGTAEVTSYEPESVTLAVSAATEGFLVLTDQYAGGWKAALDGNPVPLYRANAVFRAVRVPLGKHEVRFVYTPESFRIGAMISGISWGGLLAGLWVWRRRGGR